METVVDPVGCFEGRLEVEVRGVEVALRSLKLLGLRRGAMTAVGELLEVLPLLLLPSACCWMQPVMARLRMAT